MRHFEWFSNNVTERVLVKYCKMRHFWVISNHCGDRVWLTNSGIWANLQMHSAPRRRCSSGRQKGINYTWNALSTVIAALSSISKCTIWNKSRDISFKNATTLKLTSFSDNWLWLLKRHLIYIRIQILCPFRKLILTHEFLFR